LFRAITIITLAALITSCQCGGDAPMLTTPLPNGYFLNSNGGSFGVIYGPAGSLDQLKKLPDDTVRWCNAFGWEGSVVVCETEHGPFGKGPYASGYLILNTETAETWLAASESETLKILNALSVAAIPKLATSHFFSTREQ